MNEVADRVKKELLSCARRAYTIGLQTGNGGNLSVRVPDTELIIIKGSGYSFGETTMDNLVTVNMQGEIVDGPGKPSMEIRTHRAIYRTMPHVYGIFHCHSPWATAYAEDHREIPAMTFHAEAKMGAVPVLNVAGHGDEAVEQAVESLLGNAPDLQAFVQARHGIFAMAATIAQAEHDAELVEETAQIAFLVELRKK